jgi:uncharacterized membrane protein YdjX (TVP38/TMEM64 family)
VSEHKKGSGFWRWVVVWVVLLAIPLVPFGILMTVYEQDPFEVMVRAVEGKAVAGLICFSLLASDVFLPIPSSMVAVVSGGALGALAGGLLNWISITVGHSIGFALARKWGRPLVERFVGAAALTEADRAWQRGATAGLIISRPIPVLAEALSMFAGLTGFSWKRFVLVALVANAPHSFIYSWAGARFHDAGSLSALVLAGVGVPTLGYLGFIYWSRVRGAPKHR